LTSTIVPEESKTIWSPEPGLLCQPVGATGMLPMSAPVSTEYCCNWPLDVRVHRIGPCRIEGDGSDKAKVQIEQG
jgi:hypothetical protein